METVEDRSRIMRAVKSRNTEPELIVRRLLHGLGFRYRLHRPDLPGKPDLAFSGRRKAIFVHGCFWHGHDCARGARTPKNNRDYWTAKISRNKERDVRNDKQLRAIGWSALTIWECELNDRDHLAGRCLGFLEVPKIPSAKPLPSSL